MKPNPFEQRLREHAKRLADHRATRSALSERDILDIKDAALNGAGWELEGVLCCVLSNPVVRVCLPTRLLADVTTALANFRGLSPRNQVAELSDYAEAEMRDYFASIDEPHGRE